MSDRWRTSNQDYGPQQKPTNQGSGSRGSSQHHNQTRSQTGRAQPARGRGQPARVHVDDPTYFGSSGGHDTGTSGYGYDQKQAQAQRQRSKQASKQMAYDVFGNVITAMETFEKRNGELLYGKSNIPIPSQSWKNDGDVKASVEAQLRVFEQHMRHCPEDVKNEIRPQMKKMTVDWMAARGRGKRTKTDDYAVNLFEIIGEGSTKHDDDLLRDQRQMGKKELLDNFGKVVQGQAKADELDREFKNDPYKTAKAPEVRRGASTSYGEERLAKYMQDVPGYHGSSLL